MDYELLKLIWWLLIGMLLIGLMLIEGLELGACVLMPLLTRLEARCPGKIQSGAAPHGVLLWLATVAATLSLVWPKSGLLPCLGTGLVALLMLLRRPGQQPADAKGRTQPWAALVIGLLPALLFGIALGNVLLGLPLSACRPAGGHLQGALIGLFRPFALLAGLVSVSMLCQLGAAWVMLRGEGAIRALACRAVYLAGALFVASFAVAVLWSGMGLRGYSLSAVAGYGGLCSPSHWVVLADNPGWQANFKAWPWAWLAPVLAISGALLALFAASRARAGLAILGAGLAVCATVCSVGLALFPFIVPSSVQLSASLTVWNVVGSEKRLGMMLIVASVLAPMLLAYTLGGYLKGRGVAPVAWPPKSTRPRGGMAPLEGVATRPSVISK